MVRLTVTDTGIGIAPEKLPYIFNRFYQIQEFGANGEPRQYSYPGTGIGLALVKELAELMGGGVSVSSETERTRPNAGTTFTVDMPLLRVSGKQ